MLFCGRRRPSLFTFLLALLGFKVVLRDRMSEDDRQQYRAKRKLFKRKIREAFAVWDEDEDNEASENV